MSAIIGRNNTLNNLSITHKIMDPMLIFESAELKMSRQPREFVKGESKKFKEFFSQVEIGNNNNLIQFKEECFSLTITKWRK